MYASSLERKKQNRPKGVLKFQADNLSRQGRGPFLLSSRAPHGGSKIRTKYEARDASAEAKNN